MDVLALVLAPMLLLLLAASLLLAGQAASFLQSSRYRAGRKKSDALLAEYVDQIVMAQTNLAQRAKDLETLSRKLDLSNRELARLNGMKSKFLSMAVHDMRSPMAAIRGFSEIMIERPPEHRMKSCLTNIIVAVDRMERLLSDLTDLAMIESGKLRMNAAPFAFAKMVAEIVPVMGIAARDKGVEFVVHDDSGDAVVFGDRFRLSQVLQNLLNNAIKFTPKGGKVWLNVLSERGGVRVQVRDTGPGIHASEKSAIFEKFYQSTKGTGAARMGGWGLGLSIAQEIVRFHKGEIGVDSPGLGKGSTFYFKVPPAPAHPAQKAVPGLASLCAAVFLLSLPAFGQEESPPLDDKVRFERALEQKAETVLDHMLGPGQAKVAVDANLDFTRKERVSILIEATRKVKSSPMEFLWEDAKAKGSGLRLLPGFSLPGEGSAKVETEPSRQTVDRQLDYPESFVKKMLVTVLLNRAVSNEQADAVTNVVTELFRLNPERGDALTVVRADFPPPWKTIWYRQESAAAMFRYLILSLMSVLILLVVGFCIVRLAEALRQMAKAQIHQIQMDAPQKRPGIEVPEGKAAGPGLPGPGGGTEEALSGSASGETEIFDVEVEQVETLFHLLKNENPSNIALVMHHLKPEVSSAFFSLLPKETAAKVTIEVSKTRFVESDAVSALKEELERRVKGTCGGFSQALKLIEGAGFAAKKSIIDELASMDPALAREVRKNVLFFDDLVRLSDAEWGMLVGRASFEEWAAALLGASAGVADKLKACLPPRSWKMIEQLLASRRPPQDKILEAQESILVIVWGLIREGLVANPLRNMPELLTGASSEEGRSNG